MFNNDLKRGKIGENKIALALSNRGHMVVDVSDIYEYQRKDIDFKLTDKSGNTTTLEVKTDEASERTGNVFIEYFNKNNISRKYKGWYHYCEAVYMAFVQPNRNKAYIVSRYDLYNSIANKDYRTASSYDACGFLVPLNDLRQMDSFIEMGV